MHAMRSLVEKNRSVHVFTTSGERAFMQVRRSLVERKRSVQAFTTEASPAAFMHANRSEVARN
jgi:hypothetical protein